MKFIKSTIAFAFVLIFTFVLCSCGKNDNAPKGMQPASSEFVDYNLYVPDTWTIDKTDGVVSAYVAEDKSNISVTTFTPTREYKSVVDYISEYLQTLEKTYVGYKYISEESRIPTAEKLDTGISLGGVVATRIVYKLSQGDTEYKIMQVIISAKGYVYTLTYTALADKYDAHIDDVYKIISEFKFK